jgi:hypothetical protein
MPPRAMQAPMWPVPTCFSDLQGKNELADKYLDLFCRKSDTAKQYVQKWLPIVAASQSVKGKPEEKEFLASWVRRGGLRIKQNKEINIRRRNQKNDGFSGFCSIIIKMYFKQTV